MTINPGDSVIKIGTLVRGIYRGSYPDENGYRGEKTTWDEVVVLDGALEGEVVDLSEWEKIDRNLTYSVSVENSPWDSPSFRATVWWGLIKISSMATDSKGVRELINWAEDEYGAKWNKGVDK